jgi:hypothetical protein
MSITYELINDVDNWSYILTVDINRKLTQNEKDTINNITYAVETSLKLMNYKEDGN